MSKPIDWYPYAPPWHRRPVSLFVLWANEDGTWTVDVNHEEERKGTAKDLAGAQGAAEDALRALLTEAQAALGDGDVCEVCLVCLDVLPKRCERHAHTEAGDPEWDDAHG